MADNFSRGISIDKISIQKSDFKTAQQYEEATQSHRDEGHTFHIVENGTVLVEIDFQKYEIIAPAVVYMHPNQVHRILDFNDITVCSLSITNECLNPEYLGFLEEIAPAKPLALTEDVCTNIADTFSLCFNISKQKSNRLYHLLLKDSCNTLVALIASVLLSQHNPSGKLSRTELIAKSFRELLERNYRTIKRPGEYAKRLNISTPYLNESIKNATGLSVSQHIQDRIILEAKRLLYHTDKSVKEIAFNLGYVDYPYFSRLFTKATGMSALAFRNKNND
ncbi:MAG: AraC family transcriptional regulator [Sphingobacteriaceae bacterium]|nr:MAG: AraC family transcriptional regulator [Sphingobacteriaceae bacterium]